VALEAGEAARMETELAVKEATEATREREARLHSGCVWLRVGTDGASAVVCVVPVGEQRQAQGGDERGWGEGEGRGGAASIISRCTVTATAEAGDGTA
jgi:hypothetical protein